MPIQSISDLTVKDFSNKLVIKELNLFLNDYCKNMCRSEGLLSDVESRIHLLCEELGFLTARGTWKGGYFPDYILQTLFKNQDFSLLHEAFEEWQFENRASGVDEHQCR